MNLTVSHLLLLCFLSTAVNTKSVAPEGKIVGGYEATPHSHPYLVSLQTRFLWVRVHACGGAILNERWVLSAAHCATESWLIRWLPLDVVAGIHDVNTFGSQAQVNKISERIPHPLYDGGIGPYDIGLFKTVSPFIFSKYIQPIRLPNNNKIVDGPLKVPGWGVLKTTFFIPDLPSRLQEVKVTYIPYNECFEAIEKMKEGNEKNPLDRDANLCTGPMTGGIAACSGDSGGPLVQYLPNGLLDPNDPVEESTEKYNASAYNCNKETTTQGVTQEATEIVTQVATEIVTQAATEPTTDDDGVIMTTGGELEGRQNMDEYIPIVIGIVSWGVSPCGEKGAPTIYTNVSTYIDFINYHIKDLQ